MGVSSVLSNLERFLLRFSMVNSFPVGVADETVHIESKDENVCDMVPADGTEHHPYNSPAGSSLYQNRYQCV